MNVSFYQVDAFTNRPFAGNPAAVCLLKEAADAQWMQHVAAEMNLAETAFVYPLKDEAHYDLRWFTPTVEVPLCGHATLATAHVLWETEQVAPEQAIRFRTQSGLLTCTRRGEWIEMDFPAEPITLVASDDVPDELLAALNVPVNYIGRNRMDYLVELASEEDVRTLTPDIAALGKVSMRGLIVTARSSVERFDFVSRFFGPAVGVDEDPVTGSAHCALGPYWAPRLGKSNLVGHQLSRRGGTVGVGVRGDRVLLSGQAVAVLRGELLA